MDWNQIYADWQASSESRNDEGCQNCLCDARQHLNRNTPAGLQWLADALEDTRRNWFVAQVFESQTVPGDFSGTLLRAGILERNPSFNRSFIEPCLRSQGGERVLKDILHYLEFGDDREKAGAASALYWASGLTEEELPELRQIIRCQMLREFVSNPDLEVRRRIIPMLNLKPSMYPDEVRRLIPKAIEIARAHPDDYIRHRVEIQLGAGGPYRAIPTTE